MEVRSVEVRAQGSWDAIAGRQTRRDPLSAVSPELQLKYQDVGSTVTNWDRVRPDRKPNYQL